MCGWQMEARERRSRVAPHAVFDPSDCGAQHGRRHGSHTEAKRAKAAEPAGQEAREEGAGDTVPVSQFLGKLLELVSYSTGDTTREPSRPRTPSRRHTPRATTAAARRAHGHARPPRTQYCTYAGEDCSSACALVLGKAKHLSGPPPAPGDAGAGAPASWFLGIAQRARKRWSCLQDHRTSKMFPPTEHCLRQGDLLHFRI